MRTLSVSLRRPDGDVSVGEIVEFEPGRTRFDFADAYLEMGETRPILGLAWHSVKSDELSRKRMASLDGRLGVSGILPAWFSGLLPEGALREMVELEMGPGRHGEFDVLRRLGGDLPGAVVVEGDPLSDPTFEQRAREMAGLVRFSLAGVQLKFSSGSAGDRLTFPALGRFGPSIVKTAGSWRDGIEAEHAALTMAAAVGVETAPHHIVRVEDVPGIPKVFRDNGEWLIVSSRFDRRGSDRIHMEDFGQILGSYGDQKYTRGNLETVLNMVSRFSSDRDRDVAQGFRRVLADIALGNGDAHLKNWSFTIDGRDVRLSPAYDIVPTAVAGDDQLALEFRGTKAMRQIGVDKLERVATFLGMAPGEATRMASEVVDRAFAEWPSLELATDGADRVRKAVLERLSTIELVRELSPARHVVRMPEPGELGPRIG